MKRRIRIIESKSWCVEGLGLSDDDANRLMMTYTQEIRQLLQQHYPTVDKLEIWWIDAMANGPQIDQSVGGVEVLDTIDEILRLAWEHAYWTVVGPQMFTTPERGNPETESSSKPTLKLRRL